MHTTVDTLEQLSFRGAIAGQWPGGGTLRREPTQGLDQDEEVRYRVDHDTMLQLKQFYDRDVDVQICRRRKLHEVWKHKWEVGLWLKGETQLMKVKLLNQERYQTLLRKFFAQAHDHLVLFQFVGIYHLRDMEQWYAEFELEQQTGIEQRDALPFGVVDLGINRLDQLGHYDLVRPPGSMQRHLEFICECDCMNARYEFFVYDVGAQFEPLIQYTGHPGCVAGDIQVVSPFTQLRYQRSLVHEAQVCQMDANFQRSHTVDYIELSALPETKPSELPEDVRYAMDSLSQATHAQSLERIKQTTAMASHYRDALNRGSYARVERRAARTQMDVRDVTVTQERLAQFGRPTARETLEPLPECMKIARGADPDALVDPSTMQQRYDASVCEAMEFPFTEMKPHAAHIGTDGPLRAQTVNPAQLEHAQRQLGDCVMKHQNQCSHLFGAVYPRSFGQLDQRFVSQNLRHPDLQVRLTFDNVMTKTTEEVAALLPFYEAGLLGDLTVWEQLARTYHLKANKGKRRDPDADKPDKGEGGSKPKKAKKSSK